MSDCSTCRDQRGGSPTADSRGSRWFALCLPASASKGMGQQIRDPDARRADGVLPPRQERHRRGALSAGTCYPLPGRASPRKKALSHGRRTAHPQPAAPGQACVRATGKPATARGAGRPASWAALRKQRPDVRFQSARSRHPGAGAIRAASRDTEALLRPSAARSTGTRAHARESKILG